MRFRGAGFAAALYLVQPFPVLAAVEPPYVEVQGGDASEVEVASDGSTKHVDSGFVFPRLLGSMPLRGLTVYGPADASAYYTLGGGANGDAWITFYVYPVTMSLAEDSAGVEQSLLENLKGHRIDPPGPMPSTFRSGRVAWFEGRYQGIDAKTGYMLVQRGQWFLKARATIPKRGGVEAIDRAVRAIAALQWDWEPPASRGQGAEVAVR